MTLDHAHADFAEAVVSVRNKVVPPGCVCFVFRDMCIVNYKIYKPNIIGVMFAALAHDLGLKTLYHAMVGVVSAPMIARMDL